MPEELYRGYVLVSDSHRGADGETLAVDVWQDGNYITTEPSLKKAKETIDVWLEGGETP